MLLMAEFPPAAPHTHTQRSLDWSFPLPPGVVIDSAVVLGIGHISA